ncbi:MAG: proton-conducting membrane transporter [Clostridiales bacterium]|nr:proton-conducting membrane transporter [Clostridiales bacterium]
MELTEIIKNAGIVGAGGAGFPTHVKLNTKAECFIVNAAECEPLIETDKFLCRTFPDKIVGAAAIAAAHLGAKRTVIALKGKYRAEIDALRRAVENSGAKIELFEMPSFYPAGDEQSMVQMVTGRTVPERGIPIEVGAVVDNVGTMFNLFEAVKDGKPVCDKYLSVVGEVREPVMLHVPIGTKVTECIEKAEPKIKDYAVIIGGPMMGKILADPREISESVVTKTTGNIIVLHPDHYLIRRSEVSIERIKKQAKSACIQCRMCTDLCPRYLIGHKIRPNMIMRNLWREDLITDNEEFGQYFGEAVNCCDCGLCEMFSCPMHLSPRKINVYMKQKLRERGIKVEKTPDPSALDIIELHRVPTERLVTRLGLSDYYPLHAHECLELSPDEVYIPFSQHIGKPAEPCKSAGEQVEKGELLAAAAEGALSANIHSSISGFILSIDGKGAQIRRKEEKA